MTFDMAVLYLPRTESNIKNIGGTRLDCLRL